MIIFTCLWSINLLITSNQERMKDRNQGRETEQISRANNVLYVFLYEAFYCFRSPLLCHVARMTFRKLNVFMNAQRKLLLLSK